EQELGQVGTVLSGDAGDQRGRHGATVGSKTRAIGDRATDALARRRPRAALGDPGGSPHAKRGAAGTAPLVATRDELPRGSTGRRGTAPRSAADLVGMQAAGADLHPLDLSLDNDAGHLEIRFPRAS